MTATPTQDLGFQNFFQATLTGDITASSTDILMDNIPNASQGFLVIEPDSATNREVIFYNSKTALKVVCPSAADGRGQDDTTAVAHSTGATVIMAPVSAFLEALQSMLATANDAVKSRHIDWGATGGGDSGGIWWEEIARATLSSSAASISLTSIPARKYLHVIVMAFATGGTVNMGMRFNNDSSANYTYRYNTNGGADGTGTSQTTTFIDAGLTSTQPIFSINDIINIANQEKYMMTHATTSAAGNNANNRTEISTKWTNTTNQITRMDIINPGGTGQFATGTEVIVLGHN